jgi:hypothetical protein
MPENKEGRSRRRMTRLVQCLSNYLKPMNIPKSKYQVGDRVLVKSEETPDFEATVSGVWWLANRSEMGYSVIEDDGGESDGYTDDWLSPLNV